MIDQAIDDLMALLPIEGPPAQEGQIAAYIRQRLHDIGVPAVQVEDARLLANQAMVHDNAHTQSEYGGEVGNLIVRIQGRWRGPRLMFSTHMDTVPNAVGCRPRLERDQNRIVNEAQGRALGGDNRLGCAALLDLARALVERQGDHPPITLVFFVQEEVGLVGARGLDLNLLGDPAPSMCYNLDGGRADEFVTSVIGTERFTIELTGIASHAGARPADGLSAGVIAAHAIAALDRAGWHGRIEKDGGTGSANLGIVNGGQGSNVVMPSMHILAEARSHDARSSGRPGRADPCAADGADRGRRSRRTGRRTARRSRSHLPPAQRDLLSPYRLGHGRDAPGHARVGCRESIGRAGRQEATRTRQSRGSRPAESHITIVKATVAARRGLLRVHGLKESSESAATAHEYVERWGFRFIRTKAGSDADEDLHIASPRRRRSSASGNPAGVRIRWRT